MKFKKLSVWIFACVPLLLALVMLPTLADIVPVHWDFRGNANRLGSKYELLAVPVIPIIFQFLFLFLSKKNKDNAVQNSERLFWRNIIVTLTFLVLTVWVLHLAGK